MALPTADSLIPGLFRVGGPLHGKSHLEFVIADVDPDNPHVFVLKDYVKGQANLEEAMKLTAIKVLGWPDPSPKEHKADMVYRALGLVLECDEIQHYDPTHIMNAKRPFAEYQNQRDRDVNKYYLELGFTVIRLRACYREIHTYVKGKNKGATVVQWTTFTLSQVAAFTREAIAQALLVRSTADRGQLLVYPESSPADRATEATELFRQSGAPPMPVYANETIFQKSATMAALPPALPETLTHYALATESAMAEARAFLDAMPAIKERIRKRREKRPVGDATEEASATPPDAKRPRYECGYCGSDALIGACAGCQVVYYCSYDHQKLHWETHSAHCH